MTCNLPSCSDDSCKIYDLCEVTITGGNCVPDGTNKIICEGFSFTSKLDTEVKQDCSCYEGYGVQMSNLSYEWEISNPCDYDWFDQRFVGQLCDKYSMSITGYVQEDCGNWVEKETLNACIIESTGREYGKGLQRSISGIALNRTLSSTKTSADGTYSNSTNTYKRRTSGSNRTQGSSSSSKSSNGDPDFWTKAFTTGINAEAAKLTGGMTQFVSNYI